MSPNRCPGDSLGVHRGMKFSTMDSSDNACASVGRAGWWYLSQETASSCGEADLNGLYENKYAMWKQNDGSQRIQSASIKIRSLDFIKGIYFCKLAKSDRH